MEATSPNLESNLKSYVATLSEKRLRTVLDWFITEAPVEVVKELAIIATNDKILGIEKNS